MASLRFINKKYWGKLFIVIILLVISIFIYFYFTDKNYKINQVRLTEEEKHWLEKNSDKLILFFDWKFPPIEFLGEDGEFHGLGADIIKAIEKRIGIQFHKKVYTDWAAQIETLKNGTSAIAPVIVDTPSRREYILFTKPYVEIPVVIITSQKIRGTLTLDMLKNRRVAVVNEYATEEYLRKNYEGLFEIVEVKNIQEGLRDVSFGVVDALVENLAVASYYIQKEKLSNLRVAGNTDYVFRLSIGVSKHYPQLFAIINRSLNDISNDELNLYHSRWISLDYSGFMSEETLRLIKITGLFMIILIISLISLSWFLKKRLNSKITDLEQTQTKLQESEALSKAIMDQSYQFIILIDHYGKISECNQKTLNLTGLSKEEVYGKFIWELPLWKDLDEAMKFFDDAIKKSLSEEFFRDEITIFDFYRNEHYIDLTISPMTGEEQKVIYVIIEGQDITDKKEIELEKEKLMQQLIHSQKMDAIGKLAGGIAHDFNNALTAISGSAELLTLKLQDHPELLKFCQNILSSSQRAGQLTKKLLTFSRKNTLHFTSLNVHSIIDETVSILRQSIDRKIEIKAILNANKFFIKGESSLLQNALMNLGINSRDALPEGGEILFRTENILLDKNHSSPEFKIAPGEYIRIYVVDNGIGIPPEIQEKIFEPFFTTKELGKGTGLGLSTVYGSILEHKGQIHLKSEVGKGTEFIIDLPIFDEAMIMEAEVQLFYGSGKILLIDDEDTVRATTSTMLQTLGYEVIEASSGIEGIELFKKHKEEIVAVLCDMIMPALSGKETLLEIKKISNSVPLIICSGYITENVSQLIRANIAKSHIRKPFTLMDLSKVLETFVIN